MKEVEEKPEHVTGPVVLRKAVRQYLTDKAAFRDKVMDLVERNELPVDEAALELGRLSILPSHSLYRLSWYDRIHARFLREANVPGGSLRFEDAEARGLFPGSVAVTFWMKSWGRKGGGPALKDG